MASSERSHRKKGAFCTSLNVRKSVPALILTFFREGTALVPMRYLQAIGVALLLSAAGCSTTGPTTSYDASKNQMTYESADVNVAQLGAAVGSGSSIVLRPWPRAGVSTALPKRFNLSLPYRDKASLPLQTRAFPSRRMGPNTRGRKGGSGREGPTYRFPRLRLYAFHCPCRRSSKSRRPHRWRPPWGPSG